MAGEAREHSAAEEPTQANEGAPTSAPHVTKRRVSRRTMLRATAGGVVATAGVAALYGTLAHTTTPPRRTFGPPKGGYPTGQYEVSAYGVRVQDDAQTGIAVDVPPMWNLVVTASLTRAPGTHEQRRLEAALVALERAYPYSPAGIFALVGYGLPYFRAHIAPSVFERHVPRTVDGTDAPVLIDAVRFPSDPSSTRLEANDIIFHLRSDVLDHLRDAQRALFERSGRLAGQSAPDADLSDLFHVTSVRVGFVGAGMPRQLAREAKLPVAERIPEAAPLFMGFTSTQQLGQAKEVAVRFDGKRDPLLKPLTTARPGDYFAGGTVLHVSHLFEDLDAWYALSYDERVARMFNPGAATIPDRVTVATSWLNPNPAEFHASAQHLIGHNEAVQRASRAQEGQALQLRVDFNTLDALDGDKPAPGVHFLSLTPSAQIFHASRKAMDATDLTGAHAVAPSANGINAFLHVTRRQNYLVPPRAHRAFPLLEVRA